MNRYLLDNIALAGRGEVQYILDQRNVAGAAERFYERVRTPVLTNVTLDFGSLAVNDIYPKTVPDLFSSTPIIVKGRYQHGGRGVMALRGKTGQGPFERKIDVEFPENEPKNEVLASLWARAKIEELMTSDLTGIQRGTPDPAVKEEIIGLGLRYQLMSQFTSFVAVEEKIVTSGGQAKTVSVPVEMPEGVSYEGVFGNLGMAMAGKGSGISGFGGMRGGKGGKSAGRAGQVGGGAGAAGPGSGRGMALEPAAREKAGEPQPSSKPAAPAPAEKLSEDLRTAIEKAATLGPNATFTVGKAKVSNGRISVRVRFTNLSNELLARIRSMGFTEGGRSPTMLNGSIDISQLKALSELAEVTQIEPL